MAKKNVTIKEGIVVEALPNTTFRIELTEEKRLVLCTLAGKMRMHRIRVLPGDKVKMEFSPYDDNKGRITYRIK